jgi:hypothetical protein
MRLRTALGLGLLGLAAWGLLQAQAPWKEYPALEYENFEIPTDWNQKTEWTRARLRYPDIYGIRLSTFACGTASRSRVTGRWTIRGRTAT